MLQVVEACLLSVTAILQYLPIRSDLELGATRLITGQSFSISLQLRFSPKGAERRYFVSEHSLSSPGRTKCINDLLDDATYLIRPTSQFQVMLSEGCAYRALKLAILMTTSLVTLPLPY